jgi:hypothetical protein
LLRTSKRQAVQDPSGVLYASLAEAARAENVTHGAIWQRCRKGNSGWRYVGPLVRPICPLTGLKKPWRVRVADNRGVIYPSIADAARRLGVSRQAVHEAVYRGRGGWRIVERDERREAQGG